MIQHVERPGFRRRIDVPADVCLCTSCGIHFEDAESYDAHIVTAMGGAKACLNLDMELVDEGFVKTSRGLYVLFD